MFKRMIMGALVLGAVATPPPAANAMTCAPRERIVESLGEKFGEARHAAGVQSPTQVVELWASDETGSWTLLVTNSQGTSCIIAAGKHWTEATVVEMAGGDPA